MEGFQAAAAASGRLGDRGSVAEPGRWGGGVVNASQPRLRINNNIITRA